MRTSLVAVLALSACSVSRTTPPEACGIPASLSEVEPDAKLARGSELFATHCAVCHGAHGHGDGPAAPFLFPPARRFDAARFRLVSSENGAPFDRDLVADLVVPTPHAGPPPAPGEVRSDVPLYRRFLARLEPSERVDHLVAEGIAALPGATRVSGEVEARAEWQAGRWSVVFRRALVGDETPFLVPGRTLQVACAVWNGAVGDAGARKSISIWQELVLDD